MVQVRVLEKSAQKGTTTRTQNLITLRLDPLGISLGFCWKIVPLKRQAPLGPVLSSIVTTQSLFNSSVKAWAVNLVIVLQFRFLVKTGRTNYISNLAGNGKIQGRSNKSTNEFFFMYCLHWDLSNQMLILRMTTSKNRFLTVAVENKFYPIRATSD